MENLEIDATKLTRTLLKVCHAIEEAAANTSRENTGLNDPATICRELERFSQIVLHLDKQRHESQTPPTSEEVADLDKLADHGLKLIAQMMDWAKWLEMSDITETLDNLIITLSVWNARHLGSLREIEPVVNALSKVANNNADPAFMAELSNIYHEIANAVAADIKQDMENYDPLRPWRILNLNYGIVATRSHDTSIMEQAFEQLLVRFPHDARDFFQEGMEQMDAVGYPEHVRSLMKKYYQLTNNPTLH